MKTSRRWLVVGLDTARIEAFSDGVFAVAITLLIFALNPPVLNLTQIMNGDLTVEVYKLWPKVASYIISFSVIGIFWIGHHTMSHYIKRADRLYIWLNNVFLMSICFIPFSAALIGIYPREQISVLIYGVTLTLAGILLWFVWLHASHKHHLIAKDMGSDLVRLGSRVILLAPIVYTIALLVSYINPLWSILLYVLIPILYILPGPIDTLVENAERFKNL